MERLADTVTKPHESRRASTTPAAAVSVSRSSGCQFKMSMISRSATRPEASIRLIP